LFAPECFRPDIRAAAGFKFARSVFAAVPAEFAGTVFDAPIFELVVYARVASHKGFTSSFLTIKKSLASRKESKGMILKLNIFYN
jgi:hypothetical protein